MLQMDKVYNPKDFEDKIYKLWSDNNSFSPDINKKDNFTIVIPPPNVTGVLHMGHGLNNSLQDILIRYYRMNGVSTLWLPGTDHAGIATQNVVEKKIKKEENLSKNDLGRDKFVDRVWDVKKEHHSIITKQLKKLGSSCDWSRERFTLDDGLSDAVREVFVSLYEKDLIYKGKYLVNWCPSCGTALSDDEVEHKDKEGKLYNIKYPYSDGSGYLTIATSRPETMFGDTAIAVNPDDDRYKDLVGKFVDLPLTNRKIKIIEDSYVDESFGSGAVKITPAHDPNDWDIGERHNLEKINILTPEGKLNDNVPKEFVGMSVKEARKATIEALEEKGFFISSSPLPHPVGHCYRCNTVIEPYMSEQWFVKMQPLADKALKAWEDGEIKFYPKKWENTYKHWLENIRDWCISRQLWWGHRIPVWYCKDCGQMMVKREDPCSCDKCNSSNIRQDEDVLDTWFSSWLWPFSTLGWPKETEDFKKFYPTSTLITAYDIIFFWVARMIMAGLEFTGEVPFRDIYIHQLVRDKQGRKMSKSLGNGIDPLVIIDEYGADALKFTLAYLAAQGQDILIDNESFVFGAKFCNKVWNAARYILSSVEDIEIIEKKDLVYSNVDRWIYSRMERTIKSVDNAMKDYKFNDAAHSVYDFFWNDFCDWYIEASKLELYSDDSSVSLNSKNKLVYLLEETLRILHPFVPFLTEEIYSKLPLDNGLLISQDYPKVESSSDFEKALYEFEQIKDLVVGIRTLRSEFTISPTKTINVAIKSEKEFFVDYKDLISMFIKGEDISFVKDTPNLDGAVGVSGNSFEAFVYIKDAVDAEKEIAKLTKEKLNVESYIKRTESKLQNKKFTENAPEFVVEREKKMLSEAKDKLEKLVSNIDLFS